MSAVTANDWNLIEGNVYTWSQLGRRFDFAPNYLSSAGGMVPRPDLGVVLLITHPGGGKSFDYEDYWEGDELIYTGRGQTGDQKFAGANKQVANMERVPLVFEAAGTKRLRFLGEARCKDYSWDSGPDKDGVARKIIRFRLSFASDTFAPPIDHAVERAKFFGGGESDAHKKLKEFIASNPELIGVPRGSTADVEHSFYSPDRADIVFTSPDDSWAAVEIELEGAANTRAGAWQAAKYRTLLCLEHDLPLGSPRVRTHLVAFSIPGSTQQFCSQYDIEWTEIDHSLF